MIQRKPFKIIGKLKEEVSASRQTAETKILKFGPEMTSIYQIMASIKPYCLNFRISALRGILEIQGKKEVIKYDKKII